MTWTSFQGFTNSRRTDLIWQDASACSNDRSVFRLIADTLGMLEAKLCMGDLWDMRRVNHVSMWSHLLYGHCQWKSRKAFELTYRASFLRNLTISSSFWQSFFSFSIAACRSSWACCSVVTFSSSALALTKSAFACNMFLYSQAMTKHAIQDHLVITHCYLETGLWPDMCYSWEVKLLPSKWGDPYIVYIGIRPQSWHDEAVLNFCGLCAGRGNALHQQAIVQPRILFGDYIYKQAMLSAQEVSSLVCITPPSAYFALLLVLVSMYRYTIESICGSNDLAGNVTISTYNPFPKYL